MVSSLLLQGFANLFQLGACGAPIASPLFKYDETTELSDSRLARIENGHLFTSSDSGFSWNVVSDVRDAAQFVRPDYLRDDDLVVLDTKSANAYITFDNWLTFTRIQLPQGLTSEYTRFSLNHDHPEWFIVNNLYSGLPWSVGVTRDAGKTWQYYDSQEWKSCKFAEGGQFVDGLIHCQRRNMEKEHHERSAFVVRFDTYYSTDANEPFKLVEGTPYRSSVRRNGDILTDYNSHELTISYDGIHFNKVEFPANMSPSETDSRIFVQYSDYFASKNSLLVFEPYLPAEGREYGDVGFFGNVFTLENQYELKLLAENVATGSAQQALIKPITSEDGVFIATVVANPDGAKFSNERPLYKTVITYDGGESWNPLTGPNGKELQLFIDDLYTGFYLYSRMAAPGIFSAYGNEGEYSLINSLLDSSDPSFKEIHSYLTRDSGHTWAEVNDIPVDFVIGDHGNLLIKQPDSGDAVDYLEYSTDKGYTWHKYELGFKAWIDHISSGPGGSSKILLVYLRPQTKDLLDVFRGSQVALTLNFEHEYEQDQDQIRLF